jgi:DNA repair photolyase
MIPQVTLPFLFVLSPALHPDSEAALERRLRKAVLRREPVSLGTASAPYEPVAGREASALGILLKEEGLEVSITTATPRLLREIDLLVDLDRRHSVSVRMILPDNEDPAARMQAVRTLAAEGIATSVLLPVADRELLEQAWEAGAWDVEIDVSSATRAERAPLLEDFRRLRLEYGFPRGVPGRG